MRRNHLVIALTLLVLAACQEGPVRPEPTTTAGLTPAPAPTAWHDIVVRDLNPAGAAASAAVAVDRAGVVLLRVDGAPDAWHLLAAGGTRPIAAFAGRDGLDVAGMNSALVAGTWSPSPGARRPFAWDRGTGAFLEPDLSDLPGVPRAEAATLDADGVVAGRAVLDDGGEAAFLWDARAQAAPTLLANLPGFSRCRALAMAGTALVVGVCAPGTDTEAPVAWVDGAPVRLAGPEAAGGTDANGGAARAIAVNAAGRIAGLATYPGTPPRLVVWNHAGDPPTFPARVREPRVVALTNTGWILGEGDDSVTGERNAFLAADGVVSWLPGIAAPTSGVAGGAAMTLVGRSPAGQGRDHAAAWTVDVVREPRLIIGRMARAVARYADADAVEGPDARRLRVSLDTALDTFLAGDDRLAIAILREFIDQLERLVRERRMAGTDARPLVNGALAAVTIIQNG